MDIKSVAEEKQFIQRCITVYIVEKDRDALVDLLSSIPKKAKLDRLDEYMLNNLIMALQNPIQKEEDPEPVVQSAPIIPPTLPTTTASTVEVDKSITAKSKAEIVQNLKARLDPRNEKPLEIFIKESVTFGQTQFNIKTSPKTMDVSGFYDWLIENRIIDYSGAPVQRT